jgi:hypothetical protein
LLSPKEEICNSSKVAARTNFHALLISLILIFLVKHIVCEDLGYDSEKGNIVLFRAFSPELVVVSGNDCNEHVQQCNLKDYL